MALPKPKKPGDLISKMNMGDKSMFKKKAKKKMPMEKGAMCKSPKHKMPKLGSGKRFAALEGKLAKKPGVTDPKALAAKIGAKKFGQKKMSAMAAKGKKK